MAQFFLCYWWLGEVCKSDRVRIIVASLSQQCQNTEEDLIC